MANVPWDPFQELEALQLRLHRLFGQDVETHDDPNPQYADWVPAVDIIETESGYVLKADLPEVGIDDVRVEFRDGFLTIEGRRRSENDDKAVTFHRIEREYGKFSRRFAMPADVNAARIHAEFREGVLVVRLPKTIQFDAASAGIDSE